MWDNTVWDEQKKDIGVKKIQVWESRVTSLILVGDRTIRLTVSKEDSVLVFPSESEAVSSSHQGDAAPPSDAVWKDEDLEGGVHVHSDAVINSSSDLLSLDVFGVLVVFKFEYHSWKKKNRDFYNSNKKTFAL